MLVLSIQYQGPKMPLETFRRQSREAQVTAKPPGVLSADTRLPGTCQALGTAELLANSSAYIMGVLGENLAFSTSHQAPGEGLHSQLTTHQELGTQGDRAATASQHPKE